MPKLTDSANPAADAATTRNPLDGQIIKDGAVVADPWTLIPKPPAASAEAEGELPGGKIIVPLSIWQARRQSLLARPQIGVWLDSDETPDLLGEEAGKMALIAINFPVFTDGRGFSSARLLRERYQFGGELRAIGYILRDQLYYLKRCGFNAFGLDGVDLHAAVQSLNDFSEAYQAAADQPLPLFRRRT